MNTIQIGLLALSCGALGWLLGKAAGRAQERREGAKRVREFVSTLEPPRPYEELRAQHREQYRRVTQAIRMPRGALYGSPQVCPRRNSFHVAQDAIDHALKSPRTYTGRDPGRAWVEGEE